jgi:membrane protease YdiL (CAAX protease family)
MTATTASPAIAPNAGVETKRARAGTRGTGLGWFVALAYGWTWLLWGATAVLGLQPMAFPGVLVFLAAGFGPSLSGIVLTFWSGSPDERATFWSRVVSPRRIPHAWWAVALLLFPLCVAAGLAINRFTGGSPLETGRAITTLTGPALLVGFVVAMLLGGPLAEELGWRGYALDWLLTRWTPLQAALGVGVVWALWHLPTFFIPGTTQHEMGLASSGAALLAVKWLSLSVLFTWVYLHTRRSVLAAIVMHFMSNASVTLLTGLGQALAPSQLFWIAMTTAATAIAVVAISQPRWTVAPTGNTPRSANLGKIESAR